MQMLSTRLTGLVILAFYGTMNVGAQTGSDSIYVVPDLLPDAGYFLPMPPDSSSAAFLDEILRRGYEYGHNRLIVGYHWYSDIEATALVARLHADPAFLDMIAAARTEYEDVTTGVAPAGRLSPSSSPQVYRLDGMPATDSTRSIVIKNGRKIVRPKIVL